MSFPALLVGIAIVGVFLVVLIWIIGWDALLIIIIAILLRWLEERSK